MKKFLNEFKEFALKGNVLDLAVGVIIGAAFKSIVDSLVGDIIKPLLDLITYTDFSGLAINVGTASIAYGNFITAVINFFLMAIIIFFLVKGINKISSLGKKAEEAAPEARKCPYCRSTVPDDATRCAHCTSQL